MTEYRVKMVNGKKVLVEEYNNDFNDVGTFSNIVGRLLMGLAVIVLIFGIFNVFINSDSMGFILFLSCAVSALILFAFGAVVSLLQGY